ncbi:MAG: hypothetical protein WDN49_18925 [Acetobacteraceae bacterium]
MLFNMPPGDWAAGERGTAALPGRHADFRASVEKALEYARRPRLPAVALHGRDSRGRDLARNLRGHLCHQSRLGGREGEGGRAC